MEMHSRTKWALFVQPDGSSAVLTTGPEFLQLVTLVHNILSTLIPSGPLCVGVFRTSR